jgi:hypothetical protein
MGVTLGLTCKEGHILWVFENRVVMVASGPKKDKVKRERKRLCNEELYDQYISANIIRMIK